MSRIMAVDPGEKNIGIAVSDPLGMIANPLTVVKHEARKIDAGKIVNLALEKEVSLILIGQALDADGSEGPQARKSRRMAEAIEAQTDIPVKLWDESGSTRKAKQAGIALNTKRKKRKGHLDAIAATVILQTYLDAKYDGIE